MTETGSSTMGDAFATGQPLQDPDIGQVQQHILYDDGEDGALSEPSDLELWYRDNYDDQGLSALE